MMDSEGREVSGNPPPPGKHGRNGSLSGIVDAFEFERASTEPRPSPKKIPGYELLQGVSKPPQVVAAAAPPPPPPPPQALGSGPDGVEEAPAPPLPQEPVAPAEREAVHPTVEETSVPLSQEPVVQSEAAEPKIEEAPGSLPQEPTAVVQAPVAAPAPEKLDAPAPILDGSSNVATGSGEGKIEEVVEKSPSHGIEVTADNKAAGSKVEHKEVPASSSCTTAEQAPKPGMAAPTAAGKKWRAPSDADLKAMVVIPEYLSRDMEAAVETKGEATPAGPPAGERIEAPTCPILVFINSKSGGRLGPELKQHFEDLISSYQVYDLSSHSPSAVLQYGLGCLHRMAKLAKDECAQKTLERLRILVAGGDGTVGWVLSSVGALRELPEPITVPPVGVIPLGTGNDLSRSFGWGGEFSSTSKSTLKRVLWKALNANNQHLDAKEIITDPHEGLMVSVLKRVLRKALNSSTARLDAWKAIVIPAKSVTADDIKFPHAMHPQHHVPLPSSVAGEEHAKDARDPAFEGLFFNYFSVGMDAQVAYGFHHLRDEKPWLARGRAANQMIYSSFGCTQGWFCTACSVAPRARGVSNILKLWVRKRGSKNWEDIHLPSNIRAVVVCNLKSYAGGRNIWGKPSSGRREKEGFEEQRCDDGLLEVMGLKDGWHSAFVLLEVSTAVRLCQAEEIKLELNGTSRKHAYLQMDGEPWMQPMGTPEDETKTVVMIKKLPDPSLLLKR